MYFTNDRATIIIEESCNSFATQAIVMGSQSNEVGIGIF